MKVMVCHNYYQQRGGEDQLFEDEAKLLEANGHDVIWHTVHSDVIQESNLLQVAANTIWNRSAYHRMLDLIESHRPEVLHVVNTFPLLSPAVFHAARKANVPVVATIQNYRYFCAQAMCFRNNKACEACLGKLPWRAVVHGCYRNNRMGSAVVAAMQMLHRYRNTWNTMIDVICIASNFSREKLIKAGLDGSKMMLKPNFAPNDPGHRDGSGRFAVFVGRLADEKGIPTLVEAWKILAEKGLKFPLKIVGDGPSCNLVNELQNQFDHVQWLGKLPNPEVYEWLGRASCLIFPSAGYESLPKTLIESMAVGTPVVGANIGSIPEIVLDDETGYLFPAGDSEGLAEAVQKFFSNEHFSKMTMRERCRQEFERRFKREANYLVLLDIYKEAIRRRAEGTPGRADAEIGEDPSLPYNVSANK